MVKKGCWCYSECRIKKDKKTRKPKRWFWKPKSQALDCAQARTAVVNPAPLSPPEEVKSTDAENEQAKYAYSVALATAVAAEAAAAAAQAAAEVVRLTAAAPRSATSKEETGAAAAARLSAVASCAATSKEEMEEAAAARLISAAPFPAKSKEEIAAVKIQAAYRAHMARRALRALKGLVRLKTMIRGQSVKLQAMTTSQCMQTMARVQAQVRARRFRISEENQALHKRLQQKKHDNELQKLQESMGEDWDDRTQSKEQIEAKLLSKQEAAVRREKALAYAYSHQQTWRNSPKAASQMSTDSNNPHGGWSWLERWMAGRPWESQNAIDKELKSEPSSAKSASSNTHTPNLENKRSTTAKKQSCTPGRLSVCSPRTKTPTSVSSGGVRPQSPRRSLCCEDDDARSTRSAQSDRFRRHSVTGASIRDDESIASSPAVPGYMASTKSAKAKSRLSNASSVEKIGTREKDTTGTPKKRLSSAASPAGPRRHSGTPKTDTSPVRDAGLSSQGSN